MELQSQTSQTNVSLFSPFQQLLELNIISAQDLKQVSRKMKAYAVARINREQKLATRVDNTGGTNPTWDDRFVFPVDNEFLNADTSAVTIEIYSRRRWLCDAHVGTVRVLISNFFPVIRHPGFRNRSYRKGPPPVALQVWRPSGRPQGILNVGLRLIDGSMRKHRTSFKSFKGLRISSKSCERTQSIHKSEQTTHLQF